MNKITASVHFCYKGQIHKPSVEIEADSFVKRNGSMSEIFMLIARANNYDLYSYEYEMMQAETIVFSDAFGLIAKFVQNGVLDIDAFKEAWLEEEALKKLSVIAKDTLSIENLDDNKALKKALLKAYQLGTNTQKQ